MRFEARYTSRLPKWLSLNTEKNDKVALMMATDIHERSVMLAPVDTRALVNSGKIVRVGKADYAVVYGGSKVPYARRRHWENFKNPQTVEYLTRPGDQVVRGGVQKYFDRLGR